VLDGTCDAQVRVVRAVVLDEVALDVGEREPLDVAARTDDPLAERVLREHEATRDVVGVDLYAFLVVVLVDLLEDELAFELDIRKPRSAQ
jgi:hypothetical protein